MIRMRTDFFAESLGMGTSMVVLMPQAAAGIGMEGADGAASAAEDERGVPVLYLLHGLSDDCTIWERRTSIERYATEKGIAVVMPEVRRSFYADEAVGEKYWTFVADASLSGVLDARTLDLGWTGTLGERVWAGRDIAGTADDLVGLVGAADPAALPALFVDCGTEDELLAHNRTFLAAAEERGVEVQARLRPGAHTWDFWDQSIQDVLDWLPLQG